MNRAQPFHMLGPRGMLELRGLVRCRQVLMSCAAQLAQPPGFQLASDAVLAARVLLGAWALQQAAGSSTGQCSDALGVSVLAQT